MIIELLQLQDIELLTELQPADWDDIRPYHLSYISDPSCVPLKLMNEEKIAAIGTLIHHEETAWLAHIIVHPASRNQGFGKCITQALVDRVDAKKYETISLIATDMGYPVYLKIGFTPEAVYNHFITKTPFSHFDISPRIVPFREAFTHHIFELDRLISGENRQAKLIDHLPLSAVFLQNNKVEGVYFPSLANGLIIAGNPVAGIELMKRRLQEKSYAILPAANEMAMAFLIQDQFIQERISRRMVLGKKISWRPTGIYNRVSGQIG